MEEYLRRALIIGRGDPLVFLTNPISATMLVLAVVAMGIVLMPAIRKKRDEAFVED
jgi:TctA family transporter